MSNVFKIGGLSVEELVREYGSPLYVYDKKVIEERYKTLFNCIDYPQKRILYACKANTNLEILKVLASMDAGIDAVSPGEVMLALKAGIAPDSILFTGDNCTVEDIQYCMEQTVPVNIGSLMHLEIYGQMYPGTKVSVRINPDVGAGHHGHVITGGPHTKFGIYYDEIESINHILNKYNLTLFGVHSHIGSGVLNADKFMEAIDIVLSCAEKFQHLEFIDFGGGIGVPYRKSETPINLKEFGEKLSAKFSDFCKKRGENIWLYLEPGRYIVAESGFLLAKVNNVKTTPAHKFIGVDTGFNHLIRPMAYGSYHHIINGSNMDGKTEPVVVAGNLCESGDVFTRVENGIEDREIAEVRYGDIIVICNAGAYGYSMASRYNSRFLPAEVLVENEKSRLIRKRDTFEDLLRSASIESAVVN